MVEPLRHRQTKEAATDMFCLKPPRHISTLHIASFRCAAKFVRYWRTADNGGFWPAMVCPLLTQQRHLASRYSTASAAIASTPDGMVRPSAFAVMVRPGHSFPDTPPAAILNDVPGFIF